MAHLIAQGTEPNQRWRKSLTADERFIVGREAGAWSASWDQRISRRHAELHWRGDQLQVQMLQEAGNPIYFRGRKTDCFLVSPGEHFVIGGTTFLLVNEQAHVTSDLPRPHTEQTFARGDLRRVSFRDPDQRIAALARLPDIIAKSSSSDELHSRLLQVLLGGIGCATGAALVKCTGPQQCELVHWDQRALHADSFLPSQQLIFQAFHSQASVVHTWDASKATNTLFTLQLGLDWAFCTPLGEKTKGGEFALYVAGTFPADVANPTADWLRDDLKFAELAATTFSRLSHAQAVERKWAGLSQFLSPVVLNAISETDIDSVLAPRETEITVLFCDLRGFTRHAEQAGGNLFALLERVSQALGVMTCNILAQGGVVGDFHGDSAMGFWGWPLSQSDAAVRAARAALAIGAEFATASEEQGNQLANFRVGIGIATGKAVAGKIGTSDQVKVTAFGPVVNLASRLESLTKTVQLPILIDERTAAILQQVEDFKVRKIAKVLPFGITTAVNVHELLSSEHAPWSQEQLHQYSSALDAFTRGDWLDTKTQLQTLPREMCVCLSDFLARHSDTPPRDWNGMIPIQEK